MSSPRTPRSAGSTVYAFSKEELKRMAGGAREENVSGEYDIVLDDPAFDDWLPPIEPAGAVEPSADPDPPMVMLPPIDE